MRSVKKDLTNLLVILAANFLLVVAQSAFAAGTPPHHYTSSEINQEKDEIQNTIDNLESKYGPEIGECSTVRVTITPGYYFLGLNLFCDEEPLITKVGHFDFSTGINIDNEQFIVNLLYKIQDYLTKSGFSGTDILMADAAAEEAHRSREQIWTEPQDQTQTGFINYEAIRKPCQDFHKSKDKYLGCISKKWNKIMIKQLQNSIFNASEDNDQGRVIITGLGKSIIKKANTFNTIWGVCLDIEAEMYEGNHTVCMESGFITAYDHLLKIFSKKIDMLSNEPLWKYEYPHSGHGGDILG